MPLPRACADFARPQRLQRRRGVVTDPDDPTDGPDDEIAVSQTDIAAGLDDALPINAEIGRQLRKPRVFPEQVSPFELAGLEILHLRVRRKAG